MSQAKQNFKILIADDEPDILEFLSYNLKKEGYDVVTAEDGIQAVNKARQEKPDVIILDIMMPNMDGIGACELLRGMKEFQHTVIVFLTALGDEKSEIKGFDAGGDDYIIKPIKPKILSSRIKALLRRQQPEDTPFKLTVGDFVIDREQHLVYKNNTIHSIPRKEFDLLLLLASKPGKVFVREDILNRVWGTDVIVGDRTIDVHIRKLRQRFGDEYIQTVKGVGYKFQV
jgi:two-component system alkaline phosphatase synthesis response regulator PhoP